MKNIIVSTLVFFTATTAIARPKYKEERLNSCIFKTSVDMARFSDAELIQKHRHTYKKARSYGLSDHLLGTVAMPYYLAIESGNTAAVVGVIAGTPIILPTALVAGGLIHGYSKIKSGVTNLSRKAKTGFKNWLDDKRRNKKLVRSSELFLFLTDVQRGQGEYLTKFSKSVKLSEKEVIRKVKMANVTGGLCRGNNMSMKEIKKSFFK